MSRAVVQLGRDAALVALLAVAALAFGGCDQKSDAPSPANTGAPAAAQDGVQTEEDFEEQAEKEVTAANMDSELDKLDKEIGQ